MSLKKLKLMIVDDSQVSLNYFSTILQDDLNLEMPVLDGLELIKSFKNTTDFKYTPIVVLSANTSDKRIIKAIELGAYDFLQKDLNPLIIKTKMI